MLEQLAIEIARLHAHWLRPKFEDQAAEPRLEDRGAQAGVGRPARVRSAGDVKDAFPAHAVERAERAPQSVDELPEDALDARLARDLLREGVSRVERCGRAGECIAFRRRAREGREVSQRS
jgi:hypothetical protein